ncbi:MAG: hypothetical protein ABEK59_08890 [Halobacteria archaeon]
MNQRQGFADYLKTRLGLVIAVSLVVSTATLGFIDILGATGIDALPVYVYAVIGAVAFPLSVFFVDYKGYDIQLALKVGIVAAFVVAAFIAMLLEGSERVVNDLAIMDPSLVIYTVSVAVVSSTVMVIWVNRGEKRSSSHRTKKPQSLNRN